jgi:hypothetical protein
MLHGLIMDDHNSLNLTSLLLLYLFVNILYILTLFLLLNTFWLEWSRIVTLYTNYFILSIFTCITSLWLFLDQPKTTSHDLTIYIWTLILLLSTFWHEWSRFLTNYSIKSFYPVCRIYDSFWCNLTQSHSFLRQITLGEIFSFLGQVSLRQVRLC